MALRQFPAQEGGGVAATKVVVVGCTEVVEVEVRVGVDRPITSSTDAAAEPDEVVVAAEVHLRSKVAAAVCPSPASNTDRTGLQTNVVN